MSNELQELIARAKKVAMTPAEQEEQRRSFAFGNTGFENAAITKEMVSEAASQLGEVEDPGK
jgi:hypothetical protein